jgi:hypothetical protein
MMPMGGAAIWGDGNSAPDDFVSRTFPNEQSCDASATLAESSPGDNGEVIRIATDSGVVTIAAADANTCADAGEELH